MLGHMGIQPIIANSTSINNKLRIEIMPNNELQLYTTYDMRYTKTVDTRTPLTPRNTCILTHYKFLYLPINFITCMVIERIYN